MLKSPTGPLGRISKPGASLWYGNPIVGGPSLLISGAGVLAVYGGASDLYVGAEDAIDAVSGSCS